MNKAIFSFKGLLRDFMLSKCTNKSSFTLLELMIVITIISLLALAGIPSYVGYLQRAAVVETVTVLAGYEQAIALFWSIEARLPTTGDTLECSPQNLPFGTLISNTTATPLPDSIESIQLSTSGNGVLINAVVQASGFATTTTSNRTLSLGTLPYGSYLQFACGNFTTNATAISDTGFTNIGILPQGCNYNGVGDWLAG